MEKVNLETLIEMVGEGLCRRCLGRLFGGAGTGLTNEERGEALEVALVLLVEEALESDALKGELKQKAMEVLRRLPRSHHYQEESGEGLCPLCGGLMGRLEDLVNLVAKSAEGVEFSTFQIGTRVAEDLKEREEALWRKYSLEAPEPIGREINREVGRMFSEITGKEFSRERPEVVFILDVELFGVERVISPLFIKGRYRKLERGIPQTRWPHRECGGRGCEKCNYTGKQYPTSVEEIIGEVMKEASQATNYKLHGMGREDVDALMLGRGRPFVMELSSPLRRNLDLRALEKEINRRAEGVVEVEELQYACREDVRRFKEVRGHKTYRVRIRSLGGELDEEKLKKVLSLLPSSPIRQRTPERVRYRRADRVRVRRVYKAALEELEGSEATITFVAEGGLYIKELVHGDGGGTTPSLSSELGVPLEVLQLDVLDVAEESPKEG